MNARDVKGRFVPRFTVAKDNPALVKLIEELQAHLPVVDAPTATLAMQEINKEDTRMDLFEKKELIRRAEARLGVGLVGGNDPKNILAHAAARREAMNKELRELSFLEDFAALMEKYPEQFAE